MNETPASNDDEYQDGYSIYQNDEGYFIAFIDILGFKNKIKNKSVKELYELMSGFTESSSAVIAGSMSEDDQGNLFLDWNTRGIRAMFISDSIILYKKINDPSQRMSDELLTLIDSVSTLLQVALEKDLPLRGAIGCGELAIHADLSENGEVSLSMVWGEALADLIDLEKSFEWSGVVISDQCREKYENILTGNKASESVINYQAPMKEELNPKDYYCVKWNFPAEKVESHFLGLSHSHDCHESIKEKINNTKRFLEFTNFSRNP
jgi:hypothetical protein